MASLGFKSALVVDDVLAANCFSSVLPGKVPGNRASPWTGTKSEVIGASLCRLAALSSSRSYQSLNGSAMGNDATVDGQKALELSRLDMVDEREEVKILLIEFLQARDVNESLASRAEKKATRLTAHLLSLLRMVYRIRYLTGRGPTASEIRSTLLPFLETLAADQKAGLVDVFTSFPDVPAVKTNISEVLFYSGDSFRSPILGEVKFASFPHLKPHMVNGKLPVSLVYLLEFGFSTPAVADLVSQYPCFASYSVPEKLEPMLDFLLELGVSATDVPKIILKRPQLFGCSLKENIKPLVGVLKELGVDSEGWVKILSQFPHILLYSVGKVQQVVTFLFSLGLSPKESGKVLTRFPQIIGYSVKAKMQPFADYFNSIGVKDLKTLVLRSPQLLGLSLELNIKPTILFFSDNGYTMDELSTIILRFPQLLGLSTEGNIRPKWDYFVETGRATSELVDFPQYFGYSLENRIKPRHRALEARGLSWSLNRMLTLADALFSKHLEET